MKFSESLETNFFHKNDEAELMFWLHTWQQSIVPEYNTHLQRR